MSAVLYVVSTPIGNLEDITFRAVRTLKDVALIAAEDTRHTGRLLQHYDIRTPSTSFHEHNEVRKLPALLARLARGESLALVTDAGTPGISDPGYRLVRAAREAGFRVEAVPGPSAVLSALVSSGLPSDTFTFLGFPPHKSGARRDWLRRLAGEARTVVVFEAPHRIRRLLEDMAKILGDRPICVARELTKAHEELVSGPISAVLRDLPEPRGEYTVVIGPEEKGERPHELADDQAIAEYMGRMTENVASSRRAAIVEAARHFGISPRLVYAAVERAKKQRTAE